MTIITVLPHPEYAPAGAGITVAPGTTICDALIDNGIDIASLTIILSSRFPATRSPGQGSGLIFQRQKVRTNARSFSLIY